MQLDNNNGKGVDFVLAKCPKCGADLNIEADRDKAFCTYCGAEVLIHRGNEHIYRHINDAKIKQSETELQIRLRELEIEENKRKSAEKSRRDRTKIGLGLLVGGIAFIVLGSLINGGLCVLGGYMLLFSFFLLASTAADQ